MDGCSPRKWWIKPCQTCRDLDSSRVDSITSSTFFLQQAPGCGELLSIWMRRCFNAPNTCFRWFHAPNSGFSYLHLEVECFRSMPHMVVWSFSSVKDSRFFSQMIKTCLFLPWKLGTCRRNFQLFSRKQLCSGLQTGKVRSRPAESPFRLEQKVIFHRLTWIQEGSLGFQEGLSICYCRVKPRSFFLWFFWLKFGQVKRSRMWSKALGGLAMAIQQTVGGGKLHIFTVARIWEKRHFLRFFDGFGEFEVYFSCVFYVASGNDSCKQAATISSADSICSKSAFPNAQRICCCVPKKTSTTTTSTTSYTTFTTAWPSTTAATTTAGTTTDEGGSQGDPHIQTLRGDHYTLLKAGNYEAWSFSKDSVDWQLLACYSGPRFNTQGLLLLDKHTGNTMEMTAEDCVWRAKTAKSQWHDVEEAELLSADGANFEVKEAGKDVEDFLKKESTIMLKMASEHGPRQVARLMAHCKPGDHMDFKVSMFEKNLRFAMFCWALQLHRDKLLFCMAVLLWFLSLVTFGKGLSSCSWCSPVHAFDPPLTGLYCSQKQHI